MLAQIYVAIFGISRLKWVKFKFTCCKPLISWQVSCLGCSFIDHFLLLPDCHHMPGGWERPDHRSDHIQCPARRDCRDCHVSGPHRTTTYHHRTTHPDGGGHGRCYYGSHICHLHCHATHHSGCDIRHANGGWQECQWRHTAVTGAIRTGHGSRSH